MKRICSSGCDLCVGFTRSQDTALFKLGAVAFGPFSAVGESGKLF